MKARTVFKALQYGIVGAVVIIGGLFAASATPLAGYKVFTVMSGSMTPAIPTGRVVIVTPRDTYAEGDVVTAASGDPHRPVTHRIVRVEHAGAQTRYITKGDANATEDTTPRLPAHIIGAVRAHIPLIGYPIAWVRTPVGFVVLLVIPATLLVYHEILSTLTALDRQARRKRLARRRAQRAAAGRATRTEEE